MFGHAEAPTEGQALKARIRAEALALGFEAVSFSGRVVPQAEEGLQAWLQAGFHGDMDYMVRHGNLRARPAELVPGTLTVISVRMNYWPRARPAREVLAEPARAYVSRYALGRDYHKLMRARLKKLAEALAGMLPHAYRVFCDSAPVMEVALAGAGGLGWRGKHTLLLTRSEGSWFFLGEILTDLALPPDPPAASHCGRCTACLNACPTGAIVAPYRLDARRCISYLTIECRGSIPVPLRPLIGNRIYGCDDCQLACPWNRFASFSGEADFAPRAGLDDIGLVELFAWDARRFAETMAGSAIYRIGHERWLRNLAVALGNAPASDAVLAALAARRDDPSPLVREHVEWAWASQMAKKAQPAGGAPVTTGRVGSAHHSLQEPG